MAGGLLEDAAEGVGGFGEALLDFEGVEAGESGGEFGFEFLLEGGALVGGEVAEVGADFGAGDVAAAEEVGFEFEFFAAGDGVFFAFGGEVVFFFVELGAVVAEEADEGFFDAVAAAVGGRVVAFGGDLAVAAVGEAGEFAEGGGGEVAAEG